MYIRKFISLDILKNYVNANQISKEQIVKITNENTLVYYSGSEPKYDSYSFLSNEKKKQLEPIEVTIEMAKNLNVLDKHRVYQSNFSKVFFNFSRQQNFNFYNTSLASIKNPVDTILEFIEEFNRINDREYIVDDFL